MFNEVVEKDWLVRIFILSIKGLVWLGIFITAYIISK